MVFTACYTKLENGYMGQLLEWPEVITEGATTDECREMLIDAAQEMALAYDENDREIMKTPFYLESLPINLKKAIAVNVR
ncbi:MAG: type II toxin-antitoxin system HicB family antitoxin [Synergistaceae bacterium]|nr:type II toxin-antitoxin system HicB family antitoxin [Synergistaceae bacterium]